MLPKCESTDGYGPCASTKPAVLPRKRSRGGHVRANGDTTKAAHEVKPGELVSARIDVMTRTLRVLDSPRSRVGAKLVGGFAEETTPPEEFAKRREAAFFAPGIRERGAGRPTKRERRMLDDMRAKEASDRLPEEKSEAVPRTLL